MILDNDKINQVFHKGSDNFTQEKLDETMGKEKQAYDKANHLGGFFEEFKLLWQLLKDYKSGAYRDVPWKFIAAVGFAMLYLINPLDLIPDFVPVAGYLDDTAVFGLVVATFKMEIEKYKTWLQTSTATIVASVPDMPFAPGDGGAYNPYRLPADYPAPREILKVHFPKHADELCFDGGWGYTQETATVVNTFDPEVNPDTHFDGVSLESVFIQKRIWEETDFARKEGEKFFGVDERKISQALVEKDGALFDYVKVEVIAYPEIEWKKLKAEWEAHNEFADDPAGKADNLKRKEACKITFVDEFWFRIDSFFDNYGEFVEDDDDADDGKIMD